MPGVAVLAARPHGNVHVAAAAQEPEGISYVGDAPDGVDGEDDQEKDEEKDENEVEDVDEDVDEVKDENENEEDEAKDEEDTEDIVWQKALGLAGTEQEEKDEVGDYKDEEDDDDSRNTAQKLDLDDEEGWTSWEQAHRQELAEHEASAADKKRRALSLLQPGRERTCAQLCCNRSTPQASRILTVAPHVPPVPT